jgi:hypothetical protein
VITRETFGSALILGEEALKLLGYDEARAYRMMRTFKQQDEEGLKKLYEVWGDDKEYGLRVRQNVEQLEKVLKEDSEESVEDFREAWERMKGAEPGQLFTYDRIDSRGDAFQPAFRVSKHHVRETYRAAGFSGINFPDHTAIDGHRLKRPKSAVKADFFSRREINDAQMFHAPVIGQAFTETSAALDFHVEIGGVAAPAVLPVPPFVDMGGHGSINHERFGFDRNHVVHSKAIFANRRDFRFQREGEHG